MILATYTDKIHQGKNRQKIIIFVFLESKLDIDNWENKRGPRPWEEGSIENRPIRVGTYFHESYLTY